MEDERCHFSKNKEIIWYLQTHLSASELQEFSRIFFFEENGRAFFDLEEVLSRSIKSKNKLNNIKAFLKKYQGRFSLEEKKLSAILGSFSILTRFELTQSLGKIFPDTFPLAFSYVGSLSVLTKPLVAIIGSRHPTFYGREVAHRFSRTLAAAGCTILSGGAIGVDSIANAVGLECGATCAIIGSGLKKPYPASNAWLFQNIKRSENGLLLSEFGEYESAQKWNFPRRNHSIAALADFVLVIEAAPTSGSLITAHAAAGYGTDVGAIPGNIDNINSIGTNSLIRDGAICIQTPEDVLEYLSRHTGLLQRKTDSFLGSHGSGK